MGKALKWFLEVYKPTDVKSEQYYSYVIVLVFKRTQKLRAGLR